jgi:hypothetical protein
MVGGDVLVTYVKTTARTRRQTAPPQKFLHYSVQGRTGSVRNEETGERVRQTVNVGVPYRADRKKQKLMAWVVRKTTREERRAAKRAARG